MTLAPVSPQALARMMDHTVLKPDAREADIERACDEALEHGFFSVCVNGVHTARAAARLAGSGIATCVVVGFPLGAMAPRSKAMEAAHAIADGAVEIDMVLHVGAVKAGDDGAAARDVAAVKRACGAALLKVIVETCLLDDDEKGRACRLAVAAGADFVKTSTGFGVSGATPGDVALMRRCVGPGVGVKASGGIRTLASALAMIGAGASRLGVSASVAILAEARGGSAPTPLATPGSY